MFSKSLAVVAAVVAAATVYAQSPGTPNHTFFTSPVGDGITYPGGSSQVFSWQKACTSGDATSQTPAKTEVHLVNSDNPNGAFFVESVLTIDCTKDNGNEKWTVPEGRADGKTLFALKINLIPNAAYSGNFKIMPAGGGSTPPPSGGNGGSGNGGAGGKSAASSVAPALSATALVLSAAALLL
ncbi:MAG: hypothetical protein J3Q66DRAFT_342185 [Benniella sp.]|nr:MAG: hypothetical protein J3Q66DRAFT_342185 [Benniella sp.]